MPITCENLMLLTAGLAGGCIWAGSILLTKETWKRIEMTKTDIGLIGSINWMWEKMSFFFPPRGFLSRVGNLLVCMHQDPAA